MAEPELRESWFEKPVKASVAPPSMAPPPPAPPRGARFGLGVLAGAAASALAIEAAHLVAVRLGGSDPIAMASAGKPVWVGFGVAMLVGAPFGGVLAVVLMQGSRFFTRAIFASAVSVAIWFCAHIGFLARGHTPPPLVPMLIGGAVFGVCVALIPRAR